MAEHDVLIIGAGIAGLRAAVELSQQADVAVVSKVLATRSHSGAAQGGITAALGNEEDDRWEWHMYDTVKGSDFLGDQDAIEIMTKDAPRAILELEHMGVPFSRNTEGKIAQRAFGGHTREFGKAPVKRACFASDRTGRVILDTLYEQCMKTDVCFYQEYYLLDLIFEGQRCTGAVLLELTSGDVRVIQAKAVLMATGGAGKIFKTTSNCFANTGDGLFIAFQHGIPLQDLEFIQFHPTGIKGFGILISEAARGEGGILQNGQGERFMERYAPTIKDLAPRDIVARSIMREIQEGRGINGEDYVHLDLTQLGEKVLRDKLWEIASFARIYAGIDPSKEMIPVQPTCHYMMGGLPTDNDGRVLQNGKGDHVPGLFAAGECACMSVHGANRLGTNSLLDLVVFGRRTGKTIDSWLKEAPGLVSTGNKDKSAEDRLQRFLSSDGDESVSQIREEMQDIMMERCSVFRDQAGLESVQRDLSDLQGRFRRIKVETKSRHYNYELMDAVECEHLLKLAQVIIECALFRKESRGAHFRDDFPQRDDKNYLVHTLAHKEGEAVKITTRPVRITQYQPVERKY